MRKSIPAQAAIAVLLVVAVANGRAAQAAPNDCLAGPNGAAPKGQHWYYHLDRANNRKCWYLRDLGAAATATPSATPLQQAGSPSSTANAAAPEPPAASLAPDPLPVRRNAGVATDAHEAAAAAAPSAGSAPAQTDTSAPAPSAAAPDAATVWTDPPPPAAPVQDAAIASAEQAPAVVSDPPARRAPPEHAAMREGQAVNVPVVQTASATSVAQNLLVILFAALLAGVVFVLFAVLRRRKQVHARAVGNGPRFGSRPQREDGLWLKWPRRDNDAQPAAPIQNSFIPQQVSVTRPSAPRG